MKGGDFMAFENIRKRVLRVQITTICLTVSLITSFIIVFLCYSGFYSLIKRSEIQSHGYNLSLAATSFNNAAEKIGDFAKWCRYDYDVQGYLRFSAEYDEDPSLKTVFNISSVQTYEKVNAKFFSSISTYVDRLIISTMDGRHYIHIMSKDIPTSYEPAKDILMQPFFSKEPEDNDITWRQLEHDLFSQSSDRQFIPIISRIYDGPDHMIGYIYLEISTDILTDSLIDYPLSKTMPYLEINDKLYTITDGHFAVSETDFTGYPRTETTYLNTDTTLFKKNFWQDQAICMQTAIPGICLVQKINQNFFTIFNLKSNLAILICIFSLVIVSGIIISSILKHLINTPVRMISGQIRAIGQGDFSPSNEVRYGNELGEIGKGINEMAQKIGTLMNKKIEDEKKRQELEYQILLSQINPHFLFNTLNSLKWMATIQGAQGVADMITALSHLMKNISKSSSFLIPLRDELNLLNDYFFIQRHRYGGGVKMNVHIYDGSLENCLVLRFSLQPIVENALFHGIEAKGGKGFISIQVSRSEGQLIIAVTDNGIGMSPELIRKSLYEEIPDSKGLFKNIGIYNVNQRIHYTFGDDYGISMESRENYYTKVTFRLPCLYPDPERNPSQC